MVECSVTTEVEVHMATYSLFATDHQWQVVLFERQEVSSMLTTRWNEASLVSASYLERFTTEVTEEYAALGTMAHANFTPCP